MNPTPDDDDDAKLAALLALTREERQALWDAERAQGLADQKKARQNFERSLRRHRAEMRRANSPI